MIDDEIGAQGFGDGLENSFILIFFIIVYGEYVWLFGFDFLDFFDKVG